MSKKTLNFIEHIIEEDLTSGLSPKLLRFRFPPEPNGYLHIGHVKAICLNFNLGKRYKAPVNLRFDDTNPAKEESHYVEAIKKDIEWLGFKWDKECYASDYYGLRGTKSIDISSRLVPCFYSFASRALDAIFGGSNAVHYWVTVAVANIGAAHRIRRRTVA